MSTSTKPGPESQITVELVQRVSERVAKGIPAPQTKLVAGVPESELEEDRRYAQNL